MHYFFCVTVFIQVCMALLASPQKALASELSGHIEGEVQYFFSEPLHQGQEEHKASLAVEAEYFNEFENDLSFIAVPFARIDHADSERTHFDMRELNLLWVGDNHELRFGLGKVFWGVTEFIHLADIINQTDAIESLDGEEKLGQPMAHLSLPADFGTFDFFILPGFRERTYPGRDGRLRNIWIVDTDNPTYESSAKDKHIDLAIRYSHTINALDLGIYFFNGTGREPTLTADPANLRFIPHYQQISQTGLDLQVTTGSWLLKLEAIHRAGQGESFQAVAGGFEYTFSAIGDSLADLGIIAEMAWDDRGDNATTAYEKDLMLGIRIVFNDMASSELLAGIIKDIDDSSVMMSLEGSRRLGENWKISIEASLLANIDKNDILYNLRDDDSVKIKLAYYF